MLCGKYLSILGDSISTYKGYSDDATANSTTLYNPAFYGKRFPLEKTYWSIVLSQLGLKLCVNNSFSGGNLSGRDNEGAGVNRAKNLARDDGTKPDLIIVFMGINDLGRGVSADVFYEDYRLTLEAIRENYPEASVCCVNIPDREPYFKKRAVLFNTKIADAVLSMGEKFFIADLFRSRLNNDLYYNNTIDGLHPDEDGMKIIAEVITEAIKTHEAT